MPANTTKLSLPYPVGTDLIADGDNAIANLAARLENLMTGTADFGPTPGSTFATLPFTAPVISGVISYFRRNGWVTLEVQVTVSASGAASGAALSTALPVGYRPSVQIIRQCQGQGVLRGYYLNPDGILRVDFGGSASAAFVGGFSYPTA